MNKGYFLKRLAEKRSAFLETFGYTALPETFLARDKVKVECRIHGFFDLKAYTHLNGVGCKECGREKFLAAQVKTRDEKRVTVKQFVERAKVIHNGQYDYSKVEFVDVSSKVTITCKKHGDFIQRAASHLAGCGCKNCHVAHTRRSPDEFIAAAKLVHGDRYDYGKVFYLGNKKPVEIVCSEHGSFWLKPNAHVSSRQGCRLCRDSKGERAVELFLKKNGIRYVREYRIVPHLYRYDFYLPDTNIYIEFNGRQHYRSSDGFGGQKAFETCQARDKIKAQLVQESGGSLIVITFIHLLKNTLENELMTQFKKLYPFWFLLNGKVLVYKNALSVYDAFGVPLSTRVRDLEKEVVRLTPSAKALF